jgi:hypothetical protein
MYSFYKAPWSRPLWLTSVASSVFCLSLAALNFAGGFGRIAVGPVGRWIGLALIATVFLSALFTVRSYSIGGGNLLIQRLFWTTRLPLSGLMTAAVENLAFSQCLRACGNGGMFSFSGWYWCRPLGFFRAYATDCRRTVVLRFVKRTVVVTPERPEEFVQEITRQAHQA